MVPPPGAGPGKLRCTSKLKAVRGPAQGHAGAVSSRRPPLHLGGVRTPSSDHRFPSLWAAGQVRPAGSPLVGPDERAFRYGDGTFITLRLDAGRLLDAEAQLAALAAGAAALGLDLPDPVRTLAALADILRRLGAGRGRSAAVRVQISAGPSSRGYARATQGTSWELIELMDLPRPRQASVVVLPDGEVPVPALPRVKSCSALAHVLCARAAADRGADEAVRVHRGRLVEAAAANLFWFEGGRLRTPAESLPVYPGVTRGVVLRAARRVGLSAEEGEFPPGALAAADGVFLSNAVRGIERVHRLDGRDSGWPEPLAALAEAVRDIRLAESVSIEG